MSVTSSVWSLQFPTASAYLLHLYEKPVKREPGWLSYICIQCLEAMRREQPGSDATTNNLGEGQSHLYIQKWVRDEGNRSSGEC